MWFPHFCLFAYCLSNERNLQAPLHTWRSMPPPTATSSCCRYRQRRLRPHSGMIVHSSQRIQTLKCSRKLLHFRALTQKFASFFIHALALFLLALLLLGPASELVKILTHGLQKLDYTIRTFQMAVAVVAVVRRRLPHRHRLQLLHVLEECHDEVS